MAHTGGGGGEIAGELVQKGCVLGRCIFPDRFDGKCDNSVASHWDGEDLVESSLGRKIWNSPNEFTYWFIHSFFIQSLSNLLLSTWYEPGILINCH